MRRDAVLRTLHENYPKLIESYGITSLGLFGSVARDEATDTSDVDVLVDFGAPPTFDQYMGLKIFLEDLLQCRVDLVTRRALKERIRPYVGKDVVRVTCLAALPGRHADLLRQGIGLHPWPGTT
jgi:uncharacterized protein